MLSFGFTSCANPDLEGVEFSKNPTNYVHMHVSGYGDVLIELYPNIAPDTVNNFKNLVSEEFYDGLTFHLVIKDFMIQGGDPNGDGTGGSENTIRGEFAKNGVANSLKHERGTVSMFHNDDDPNSASSQFFIMHGDSQYLDGVYAAFGKVIYGMDTVDKIANVEVEANPKSGQVSYPKKKITISYIDFVTVEGTKFAK